MPGPPKALVVTTRSPPADRLVRLGVRVCALVPIADALLGAPLASARTRRSATRW